MSVKYGSGATTPSGTTSFSYSAAKLSFSASTFRWLVTSGGKAWYRGTASVSIDGVSQCSTSSPCEFLVAAVDGPSYTTDRFRIRIWRGTTVIYDNQMNEPFDTTASVAVTSGVTSITVK